MKRESHFEFALENEIFEKQNNKINIQMFELCVT